jgi:hypothetical protein
MQKLVSERDQCPLRTQRCKLAPERNYVPPKLLAEAYEQSNARQDVRKALDAPFDSAHGKHALLTAAYGVSRWQALKSLFWRERCAHTAVPTRLGFCLLTHVLQRPAFRRSPDDFEPLRRTALQRCPSVRRSSAPLWPFCARTACAWAGRTTGTALQHDDSCSGHAGGCRRRPRICCSCVGSQCCPRLSSSPASFSAGVSRLIRPWRYVPPLSARLLLVHSARIAFVCARDCFVNNPSINNCCADRGEHVQHHLLRYDPADAVQRNTERQDGVKAASLLDTVPPPPHVSRYVAHTVVVASQRMIA